MGTPAAASETSSQTASLSKGLGARLSICLLGLQKSPKGHYFAYFWSPGIDLTDTSLQDDTQLQDDKNYPPEAIPHPLFLGTLSWAEDAVSIKLGPTKEA